MANIKRTPLERIEDMIRVHGLDQVEAWVDEANAKVQAEYEAAQVALKAAKLKELEEKIAEGERAKAELDALTAPSKET